jgi:tripartite-type tricarboxylate transporter receptor subunit TctC
VGKIACYARDDGLGASAVLPTRIVRGRALAHPTVVRMSNFILAVAFVLGTAATASAQVYPSRPITVIVPFPAGGATDVLARIMAERMRAFLGQPIVIENVAGAAGSIGVGRAVRAPADGYALSIGTLSTHVLIGALYPLAFDLRSDLEPIAQLATEPLLIVGKKGLPADDLKQLTAWLEANPGKASAGIAGVGATGHVTGIFFQTATRTRFAFVPYRGNGPALADLIAGQIDLMIEPSSNFLSQLRAGSIKAFAVTAKMRLAAAPDIPTTDEAGLSGFHASLWYGLWVPKGTPKEVVRTLNAAVVAALTDQAVSRRFADLALEIPPPERRTPEALGALQRDEIEKWWPVIKAANIKAE